MTSNGETEFDVKQSRLNDPSGWIRLTRYETVRLLVDALLEAPPEYQFNKSELERRAGVSTEAIRKHLPTLIEMGVVEEVEGSGWTEYRLNDDGKVTKELFELNSAVNSVLGGEPKNVQDQAGPSVTLKGSRDEDDESDRNALVMDVEGVDNSNRDARDDTLIDHPPNQIPVNAD